MHGWGGGGGGRTEGSGLTAPSRRGLLALTAVRAEAVAEKAWLLC